MEIVDPRVHPSLVPDGSRAQVVNGPRGDEYRDLPSIYTPDGYVITRWSLSDDERAAIVRGEDIFVTLISCGLINPFFVTVGPVDWTAQMVTVTANPAPRAIGRWPLEEPFPATLRDSDLMRVVGVKSSRFYEQKARGAYRFLELVPQLDDSHTLYSGRLVELWASGQVTARQLQLLKGAK